MIAFSSPTTSTSSTNGDATIYTVTSWNGGTGDVYVSGSMGTIYVSYNTGRDPFRRDLEDFKDALSARRALFLAWNKEARTALFKMTFDKMPFPGRTLDRFCYGRERRTMPTRQLFRKRVCGGHQRYRVIKP